MARKKSGAGGYVVLDALAMPHIVNLEDYRAQALLHGGDSFPVGSSRPTISRDGRFPLPCRGRRSRRGERAGQALVSQATANDSAKHLHKPATIHVLALVVAERFFLDVAVQVERLHADVGTSQCSLQERPEVFDAVGMDVAAHVLVNVVNELVHELGPESAIARIGV